MEAVNVPVKFDVRSFARSWDNIAIEVLVGVANPNLEEWEAAGVGAGTVRKSIFDFL